MGNWQGRPVKVQESFGGRETGMPRCLFFFEGGVRFVANSKDERFPQLYGDENVFMLRCVPRCGVVRLPEVWVIPFSHEVGKLHTSASTCV